MYGALSRLKNVLVGAIAMAILNALLQITLGYVEKPWAAWTCFATTAFSWGLVGFGLYQVSENIGTMLSYGEKAFNKKLEDAKKKPT